MGLVHRAARPGAGADSMLVRWLAWVLLISFLGGVAVSQKFDIHIKHRSALMNADEPAQPPNDDPPPIDPSRITPSGRVKGRKPPPGWFDSHPGRKLTAEDKERIRKQWPER